MAGRWRRGAWWLVPAVVLLPAAAAWAQDAPRTLADLKDAVPLSRDELEKLLNGAGMRRTNARGVAQQWTNQDDGQLVASSLTRQGRPFTEFGVWRISDEGQYCVSVAWLGDAPEAWCRTVLKTDRGYFIADGPQPGDAVRRYEITPP